MRDLLRIVLVLAVVANLVLLAFGQGWLGIAPPADAGRDPGRIAQQVRPDAIRIGPPPGAPAAPAPRSDAAPAVMPAAFTGAADAAPVAASADPAATRVATTGDACVEWGSFPENELAPALGWLAGRFPQLTVNTRRAEEVQSWMVRIPPQRNAAAAQARAAALRAQGVEDIYVFQDAGPNQHALSLGVFRTEEAARRFLDSLQAKRVSGAEVSTRSGVRTWLALRPVSAELRQGLATSRASFPGRELRECQA